MESTTVTQRQQFNWQNWYQRWETMQSAYLPFRTARFDLMFRLTGYARNTELHILDLGCGPGSLSFAAIDRYPFAFVTAVDTDPVLLTMGKAIAEKNGKNIKFMQLDIREPDWWDAYSETFDLVISATALHWLNAEHLQQVYTHIYRVLKPGGWFFNADHMASDDPEIQGTYRQLLVTWQSSNFSEQSVDNWESYWNALDTALKDTRLAFAPCKAETWEGTDDGLPRSHHITSLLVLGFEKVHIHWQFLGEVLLGAQKPHWNK